MPDTLGDIIAVTAQSLRSTVSWCLASWLPRYSHLRVHRFCPVLDRQFWVSLLRHFDRSRINNYLRLNLFHVPASPALSNYRADGIFDRQRLSFHAFVIIGFFTPISNASIRVSPAYISISVRCRRLVVWLYSQCKIEVHKLCVTELSDFLFSDPTTVLASQPSPFLPDYANSSRC